MTARRSVIVAAIAPTLAIGGFFTAVATARSTSATSGSSTMYLSPETVTGASGTIVQVEIRVTVSGDTANVVSSQIVYPVASLTWVSTAVAPAWEITAKNTGGSGAVDVEVGTQSPVAGDQLVATVTFTKATASSATVSVASTSQVISSTTNQDLLHPIGGGTTTSGSTSSGSTGSTSTGNSSTGNTTTGSTGSTNVNTGTGPSANPPPKPKLIVPNRSRTPGETNRAVTQKTIRTTICVSGWMAKVRPPVSYSNALKLKQMKQYGEKGNPSAYEEDYLIPLELGGAPKNPKNLWPEPRSQSRHSDPLETSLKRKVCAGTLKLIGARRRILAYKRIRG